MIHKEIHSLKSFIASGVGGVCTVVVGQPLDTLKVRLQAMPIPKPGEPPVYKGLVDCFLQTLRNEGPFGFYKGMAASLIGVAPLCIYTTSAYTVGRKLHLENTRKRKSHNPPLTYKQIFTAGMLSGVVTTAFVGPIERIKCLLQVQGASKELPKYKGVKDILRKLFLEGGSPSIFRGTDATLLRDAPAMGIYFMVYEWLKDRMTPVGGDKSQLSPGRTFIAGGIAGMCNWLVCIPADNLKSRLQTAPEGRYPRGIRSAFSEMRANDYVGLFRGISPVLIRVFPANAACFLGYEVSLKLLNKEF